MHHIATRRIASIDLVGFRLLKIRARVQLRFRDLSFTGRGARAFRGAMLLGEESSSTRSASFLAL